MHSYEDRMRAVALYIKLGKRVQVTIRELGYATKNTLRGWYREYERGQELPIGSAPRPPKFSEAQKQAALEHYASTGRCISWTIRALGYPGRAMLTAWVRAAFPETRTFVSGGTGPVPVLFRSGAHVKRPFVRRPRGFSSPRLNVDGADCRSR